MIRGIIAAVSPDGVIGRDNAIPWHYPRDLARFKRLTTGTTVIMGRLTWESLPRRPLANRRNIVVTSRELEGVECYPSVSLALNDCTTDVWFIGGYGIFVEAMKVADRIDLTHVPDRVPVEGSVLFPRIDPERWESGGRRVHEDDPRLWREELRVRSRLL